MSYANHETMPEPLNAHRLFQTTDVDLARATVARKFCDHELTPGVTHRDFAANHNHVAGKTLSLNYMRYGCDVTINPGELTNFYLVQLPLRGAATVRNGQRQVAATQLTGSVLNPTRETRMTWLAGCEMLLLQIDARALHQIAERLSGHSIPHPIVFDPEVRISTPALRNWEKKFKAAVAVADRHGAFGNNMHKHQALFEEDLIASFLLAQQSTIQHVLTQNQTLISSTQVNRARAFISANLSEPITVGQIADAAGCSIRGLQVAFQQSFGSTPIRFLQRQRLNYAHMLMQSLTNETRVSDIAYEAGFSHLGRFSIAYRAAFECSPKETLKREQFS